jgi:hypothetical protein
MLARCSSMPVPPTYTQEELAAICERQGRGWWHSDNLTGGFCEAIHSLTRVMGARPRIA